MVAELRFCILLFSLVGRLRQRWKGGGNRIEAQRRELDPQQKSSSFGHDDRYPEEEMRHKLDFTEVSKILQMAPKLPGGNLQRRRCLKRFKRVLLDAYSYASWLGW